MTEQKIRNAATVAQEIARDASVPQEFYGQVFNNVFHAMLLIDEKPAGESNEQS